MSKYIIRLIILAPILMAFQCEDDDTTGTFIFNDYKISVTPQSSFSINDTIWIDGKVSSLAFDTAINDSIFPGWSQGDQISIMKFIQPTQSSNCKDAIDNFELITELGNISFLPVCENGQMTIQSEINADSLNYSYRIGLKALNIGDFVLSWNNSSVTNANRNEYILDDYPLEFHPNQLGFNKCGNVSWRFVNESDKEFYFKVE
ncbi:hypothetical protein ACFSSB_15710 [Lacinutrix gracilariae]|uniref:Uncharacterized protein n=1 Tax=Lacinutrix gracilariae TaxID=1747198 RepID=A0ABW5K4C9_9FLAO